MTQFRASSIVLVLATILSILSPVFGSSYCSIDANNPLLVHTTLGDIEGSDVKEYGVRKFFQVPFAQPPVGELRWRSPKNYSRFPGFPKPYPATTVSDIKRCIQGGNSTDYIGTEDCLYMDIVLPAADVPVPEGGFPVLVWICGGAFLGCGYQWADGWVGFNQAFIYVMISYRLNIFGFWSVPQMSAENSPIAHSGNFGMQDQQMSLQWIHNHIECFNGNPSRVTIQGESAGSQAVCVHLISPHSRGLFHGAILESHGCDERVMTLTEAEQIVGIPIVKKTSKCSDPSMPDLMDCLRSTSARELYQLYQSYDLGPVIQNHVFQPIVDGYTIPERPILLLEEGRVAPIPLLVGSNTGEHIIYLFNQGPPIGKYHWTWDYIEENVYFYAYNHTFVYPWYVDMYNTTNHHGQPNPNNGTGLNYAFLDSMSDNRFNCPTRRTAEAGYKAGQEVYHYSWDYAQKSSYNGYGWMNRTAHGGELNLVFNNSGSLTTDEDIAMNAEVMNLWTRFVVTGSPNEPIPSDDLYRDIYGKETVIPKWPLYDPKQRMSMYIANSADGSPTGQFTPKANVYREEACDLWSKALPRERVPPRLTQCLHDECSTSQDSSNQCIDHYDSTYTCQCDSANGWKPVMKNGVAVGCSQKGRASTLKTRLALE